MRNATAKRKLKILKEKEKSGFALEHRHQPGQVPQYYPMVSINKMLSENRSEASRIQDFDPVKLVQTLDER